jgi:dTMP kinase
MPDTSRLEPRGRFVTVEGVEGAGKSTQVIRLAEWLKARGLPVVTTSEPDGSPLGRWVRRVLAEQGPLDPLAECFLFATARAEHVRRVIRPALDEGALVICDRFMDSTVAYQGYGRGVPVEVIDQLNRLATDGLVPDLTLVLDLDVAEGLRRVRARPVTLDNALGGDVEPDPFERLGLEFHERVRKAYRALHERAPARIAIVDASGPEAGVAAAIQSVVARRFELERRP